MILSCDKNIGLLNIFFDFFDKNWPGCDWPVYVGLEEKEIRAADKIVLRSKASGWAQRVKTYLERLPYHCILLMLDDFIIEDTVNQEKISDMLQIMKEHSDIVNIALSEIYDKRNVVSGFEGLRQRPAKGNYLLNLQMGFWRKDALFQLLKDHETPWQTELYGSIRARKWRDYRFLCLESDQGMPVKYNRGWLIVRGEWNGDEIRRLNLACYGNEIFDGKNIMYLGYEKIKTAFIRRIVRRLGILKRQFLSWFQIYI